MNIQSFQPSVTQAGPTRVGGRLDIRSDAPAQAYDTPAPARQPAPQSTPTALEGAGLLSVLNPQEQQALAAAFGESKSATYSHGGTSASDRPVVLGTQLDLQA